MTGAVDPKGADGFSKEISREAFSRMIARYYNNQNYRSGDPTILVMSCLARYPTILVMGCLARYPKLGSVFEGPNT